MIEFLKSWIITICIAVFFTTAVQMILPDGTIKKYCNFVLGLIVFIVMLNPIVKLFNNNLDINSLIKSSTTFIEENTNTKEDYEKYRNENMSNTMNNFKKKLEKQFVNDLEGSFEGDKYKADIQVTYDEDANLFVINNVDIGINDGNVERVKKIQIGDDSIAVDNQNEIDVTKVKDVKDFVSSKYNIEKNKINVYRSNSIYNGR